MRRAKSEPSKLIEESADSPKQRFDDTLKRMLATPPQPKQPATQKKDKGKAG